MSEPQKQDKPKQEKKQKQPKQVKQPMKAKAEFIDERAKLWEDLKKKMEERIQDKKGKPIKITLPDNSVKEGQSYITTPYDIAKSISQGLANASIVAKVDGQLWDMGRPLEQDCTLELLKWDSEEAREVFWHSSSHILGEALEQVFGILLCKGPPLKDGGFYYEGYLQDGAISDKQFSEIEKVVKDIIKQKQPFERLEVSKDDVLELFKYNKYKCEILKEKVPDNAYCTVYRCGELIDPCKGPHIMHTGKVGGFKVTKNSSSYWKADANNDVLQRVYGIAFPDRKQLKEWEHLQEEAKKRDHRVIGVKQELWMMHKYCPGMVFLLPHGNRIFLALQELARKEYRKRGFHEVQTPNLYNVDLWKTSGHYENYKENMFIQKLDDEEHGLKPMNCPAHCLIFKNRPRSYRELPLRIADFGVLHRNELKGALTGMTRVRRFQQDDAHIFCREDQIESEIAGALEFMKYIYDIFGFTFNLRLSTRPEKFLGTVEVWDRAEKALENALNKFGMPWEFNKGDGAFYGPKIDITLLDALKREHQCATIQLDFNLPERFELEYQNEDIEGQRLSRPVMIHRAIYGSFERFLAILTEHYAGKWPFWLSPRQIIVIPISEKFDEYAKQVHSIFHSEGFYCDLDLSDGNIKKKVRNAQLAQYNYMLVVGQREQDAKTVNIRDRAEAVIGEKKIEEALAFFNQLKKEYK